MQVLLGKPHVIKKKRKTRAKTLAQRVWQRAPVRERFQNLWKQADRDIQAFKALIDGRSK